jgi:3-hydroxyacyl-CoA dehydrogenase
VAAVADLARQAGVSPLVVGDAPGFLLPRLAFAYADEGVRLLEEGASVAEVDGPMARWGMAMGPLRLADEVGTEALARIGRLMAAARPARVRAPDAFDALARREVLGAEAGLGFYRAGRDGRPVPNPGAEAVLRGDAPHAAPPPADVRARLRAALLCEALLALEDGAVPGPAELDLAAMLGIGFPAFRGGLLWEADRGGPAELAAELAALAARFGPRFAPPPRLLAAEAERRGLYGGIVEPDAPPSPRESGLADADDATTE